jgi:serine/threonine-protein kinase
MDSRLGRYELVARLASGGMGEIFVARLEGAAGFEKLYAIKRILPQYAQDPRFRKMLIGEATIASKMTHSNICQVHELGESSGELYIVMEYLEGVTLLPLLRTCAKQQTPLDTGFIAGVMLQICDALHYAHELRDRGGESLNVIHRDVTLANVFVCESGTAKVLDFGIAKVKDAQATQTDTVKGKYAYMAPEQLRGEALDRRVDVFALGIVLYEMLALRRLFQRQTDYLTFHAVLEQPIADLRRYRPDIPDALVAVVMRALEREADRRFSTVRQLGSALADACGKPWPQDAVGELVRAKFAAESAQRTTAIARAITHPALDDPPIASNVPDEEDDGFPAVETAVGEISSEIRTVVERRAAVLLPAVPTPIHPPPPEPAHAPRSSRKWLWIVLVLMVLAGGAMAAVVAMQRQAKPTEIVIDRQDSETVELHMKAVRPFLPALTECAARHPTQHTSATASMTIAADGTLASASFAPTELDAHPLGECLRGVLRTIPFAKRNAASEFSLRVDLPGAKNR